MKKLILIFLISLILIGAYYRKNDPRTFVIQHGATSINPVGIASGATLVSYGIGVALEYSNSVTDIACANYRLPQYVDISEPLSIRIAFTSDTNTGNVLWRVAYLITDYNDDMSASGTDVDNAVTVSTTADGYVGALFTLPTPSSTDKVVQVRLSRIGGDALDTNTGNVYMIGMSLVGKRFKCDL
ncbi:MAG: hypothetical protein KQ78_02131 [Candidatus Izimaplasma bacterium HR2]|nr:MAG: hypothetical protein KQ78_02131 [Candidatus Izimaplasma bacterium HR2]